MNEIQIKFYKRPYQTANNKLMSNTESGTHLSIHRNAVKLMIN